MALLEIGRGQREIIDLLFEQKSIAEENGLKSREMFSESMAVQRLAVRRQRSVTLIAIPGILTCLGAIAYLIWRYF